jgi:putative ABC transport system substrate-binding protein
MMHLGSLALAFVLLAAPLAAEAQPVGKVYRIGFLFPGGPALGATRLALVQQGLRDLGYVDGQNVVFEARWAEGSPERLAQYAAELARLKVDVIVTAAVPAARAAKDATSSIPIVMIDPGDPVAAGLVASIARPGGNATGLTSIAPELAGKHIDLMREVLPRASAVMFLFNAANRDAGVALSQTRAVGDAVGLRVDAVPIEGPQGIETALEEIRKRRPPAVIIYPDPLTFAHRERLAGFAGALGIATVSSAGEFAHAGVLVTYGPNFPQMFRDAAIYVHKILKGTRPTDLPVEQPTKFELVINAKTAKALGLTMPPSLLLRADHVIQ